MSTCNIRLYKDSDLSKVQEIFTSGCYEYIPKTLYNALKQPQSWLFLVVGLLLPLATTGSIMLSILGGIVVLLMLWLPGSVFFIYHAINGKAKDLKDVRKYYLEREGYCFWVAELDKEIVGIVAAIPDVTSHEKNVELKRMAISSQHRGKGIAKLLCRTVIDYARKTGCNAVILTTTMLQIGARSLYEKMGFKRSHTDMDNKILQLVGMNWMGYRYDISSNR